VIKVASREAPIKIAAAELQVQAPPASILVLGLGNELLKDDGVGIRVAEALRENLPAAVDVRSTSLFGLSLLDELIGRDKVLLIDSYLPEVGADAEIRELSLDSFGGAQAACPHFVGLAEIRDVMRCLDLGLPSEVRVLAIPVSDPLTFSTELSSEVAARVGEAAERARAILQTWLVPPE
jgi:hydrogenase maturation protease